MHFLMAVALIAPSVTSTAYAVETTSQQSSEAVTSTTIQVENKNQSLHRKQQTSNKKHQIRLRVTVSSSHKKPQHQQRRRI